MPGIADVDWVVVSLKRTPERLDAFRKTNAHAGLAIELMEGVDGVALDRAALAETGIITSDLSWSDGALGAALSQRKCWERAVSSRRTVGIFEDDAYLRRDFAVNADRVLRALPDDWETLHFGFNTDSYMDVEPFPGTHARGRFDVRYPTPSAMHRFVESEGSAMAVRLHNVFGTAAYAVTPRGAQKLLDLCYPLSFREYFIPAIDGFMIARSGDTIMNEHYSTMGAYVCLPPIAMSPNDKTGSTIWDAADIQRG